MARYTPKRIVEESVRSSAALNADADGIRLYDMVRELKITPVQAVARYFCHGKGHYRVRRDYEGLLKVLALLGECDWEYDPAVKVNEGCDIKDVRERWVQWDRDNLNTQTTEIRCTEDVVERFLRPLLGETFNVASFMQRLVEQGPTPEAVEELEQAIKLNDHGGDRRSEDARKARQARRDQGTESTLKTRGGNPDYLKARLQRDHPAIAEELEQGKHRSARAAAIAAGIIRPVPTVRLVDDPQRVADAIRRHLSPEQIIKLAEALLA